MTFEKYQTKQIQEIGKLSTSPEQLKKVELSIIKSKELSVYFGKIENQEKLEFNSYFDANFEIIWRNLELDKNSDGQMSQRIIDSKQKIPKKLESRYGNGDVDKNGEKQKLELNARLANLAYSEFRTVYEDNKKDIPKLEIHDIMLDPLSFPNIARIFDKPKPNNLNTDEQFLSDYIQKEQDNLDLISDYQIDRLSGDIKDVLRLCYSGNQKQLYLAQNDEKYTPNVSDVSLIQKDQLLNKDFNSEINSKRIKLLTKGLMELKKIKIQENSKDFDLLKTKIEITDYFPNKTKNDKENSGFGAICTIDKITGKKTFVIRGTELTDWGDIVADGKLAFKKIPIEQVKNMIEFVERNITAGEQFDITGHSLGGALSQILTAIYLDNLQSNKENISNSQVYTFNAPGVKGLSVDLDGEKGQIFDKLNKFVYNNQRFETGELITRVTGTAGLNLITNLNEHMGNNEVRLASLSSHSIEKTIQYIENEAKDIEFKRIRVRFRSKEETDKLL